MKNDVLPEILDQLSRAHYVARVARRLGLTSQEKPDPMRRIPESGGIAFGPAMVLHGRYTCTSKVPGCEKCMLNHLCEQVGID